MATNSWIEKVKIFSNFWTILNKNGHCAAVCPYLSGAPPTARNVRPQHIFASKIQPAVFEKWKRIQQKRSFLKTLSSLFFWQLIFCHVCWKLYDFWFHLQHDSIIKHNFNQNFQGHLGKNLVKGRYRLNFKFETENL